MPEDEKILATRFATELKESIDRFVTEHANTDELLTFGQWYNRFEGDLFESAEPEEVVTSTESVPVDQVDHSIVYFGKYAGKTPSQIAQIDEQYIIWAYETIERARFCSYTLYKDCGGRGQPRWPQDQKFISPHVSNRLVGGFDDMDDDIPF